MTIKYMSSQNSFNLTYLDAFAYVREECEASLLRAVFAWIVGWSIAAVEGENYISHHPDDALSGKFSTALASRKVTSVGSGTVSHKGSSEQADQVMDDSEKLKANQIMKENEKLKANCTQLQNEITNLQSKITQDTETANNIQTQINEIEQQINKTKLDTNTNEFDELTRKIKEAKIENGKLNHRLETIKPGAGNNEKENSRIKGELSNLHKNEWKHLYAEIYKKESSKKENTKAMDANIANELLDILASGEIAAKNIILQAQLDILQDQSPDTNKRDLWGKKEIEMKDINNSSDLKQHIEQKVDDIIKNKPSDETYQHLKPYLEKVINIIILMNLRASPLIFSNTSKPATFDKDKFDKFNDGSAPKGEKETSEVDCIMFPAVQTKEHNKVIAKGIVKMKVTA